MNQHQTISPSDFYALYERFRPHISRLGGQDSRRVLSIFLESPEEKQSVGQIQAATGMGQANVSGCLRPMRELGLLSMEAQGKSRIYSLNKAQATALITLMASATTPATRL